MIICVMILNATRFFGHSNEQGTNMVSLKVGSAQRCGWKRNTEAKGFAPRPASICMVLVLRSFASRFSPCPLAEGNIKGGLDASKPPVCTAIMKHIKVRCHTRATNLYVMFLCLYAYLCFGAFC